MTRKIKGLPKETEELIEMLLTELAKKYVKEDLLWIRPWTKEEFEERNYKEKILKIQKDKNITLDQAIEDYITDYYQEEYEDDDFNKYDELCLLCVDQYYEAAQIAYEKYGDKYKHLTKESLDKIINKGQYTSFDYLYEKLTWEILTYTDNDEGLKKLILA